MSLVGPRAERPELVAAYQKQVPFYRARLLVKPGLTGWAQINYGYVAAAVLVFVALIVGVRRWVKRLEANTGRGSWEARERGKLRAAGEAA